MALLYSWPYSSSSTALDLGSCDLLYLLATGDLADLAGDPLRFSTSQETGESARMQGARTGTRREWGDGSGGFKHSSRIGTSIDRGCTILSFQQRLHLGLIHNSKGQSPT